MPSSRTTSNPSSNISFKKKCLRVRPTISIFLGSPGFGYNFEQAPTTVYIPRIPPFKGRRIRHTLGWVKDRLFTPVARGVTQSHCYLYRSSGLLVTLRYDTSAWCGRILSKGHFSFASGCFKGVFFGYVIGPRLEPSAILSAATVSEVFAPISYLRMIS